MPKDETANILQKMLDANAAAAKQLLTEAQKHRNSAAQILFDAQEAFRQTQSAKDSLYQQFLEQSTAELYADLTIQIKRSISIELLDQGKDAADIIRLLDLDDATAGILAERAEDNPFTKINAMIQEKNLAVTYESQGRGGHVIMDWRGQICRFWYEFAGGEALVFINIPTIEQWAGHTNIPLHLRDELLEQLAKRVVQDQAPGHRYRIDPDAIVIL